MSGPEKYAKDFIPIYPGDYWQDTGDLNCEEHGAYLQLLLRLWSAGGRIPFAPERLAGMLHMEAGRWPSVWATLQRFFTITDGSMSQKRIELELRKARKTEPISARRSVVGTRVAPDPDPDLDHLRKKNDLDPVPPDGDDLSKSQGRGGSLGGGGSDLFSTQLEIRKCFSADGKATSEPAGRVTLAPVMVFPVAPRKPDGEKTWPLTREIVDRLEAGFPHLDVIGQCRRALLWLEANPPQQKTARGMLAFLYRWCAKAIDSARTPLPPLSQFPRSGFSTPGAGPPRKTLAFKPEPPAEREAIKRSWNGK